MYSLAFDESTDIYDTTQLAILIRGINESFQVTQELLNLVSLKDTTKGEDVFLVIKKCLSESGLHLDMLRGLITDGAPAMIGKNKEAVKLIVNGLEAKINKTANLFICEQPIQPMTLSAKTTLSLAITREITGKVFTRVVFRCLSLGLLRGFIFLT